ncbi:MAG: GyrI-like domain-containing protein [bacterium]|nr:GyrI-like domain-containing protein [bacterium]
MSEETRVETCGPIEFIGVALYGDPKSDPSDGAWSLFGEVADEASISRVGKDIYGLRIYPPEFPGKLEWSYMACLPREPEMDLPIRMVAKTLPGCKYAVQRAAGGVMGIDDAIMNLYQDYIPNNGLQVAMPVDFEKYCNVTDHEKVPDVIEVWVPVKHA